MRGRPPDAGLARALTARERELEGAYRQLRDARIEADLLRSQLREGGSEGLIRVDAAGAVRGVLPCGHGIEYVVQRLAAGSHCTACRSVCSRCLEPVDERGALACRGCPSGGVA